MRLVNHINKADAEGRVYCCLRNRVVKLDEAQKTQYCGGCRMFGGFAGGSGVECVWDDRRPVADPHVVEDPFSEFAGNQIKHIFQYHLDTFVPWSPEGVNKNGEAS